MGNLQCTRLTTGPNTKDPMPMGIGRAMGRSTTTRGLWPTEGSWEEVFLMALAPSTTTEKRWKPPGWTESTTICFLKVCSDHILTKEYIYATRIASIQTWKMYRLICRTKYILLPDLNNCLQMMIIYSEKKWTKIRINKSGFSYFFLLLKLFRKKVAH